MKKIMSNLVQISAKLDRTDKSTPWGFRMQGGKDFCRPITIQRVTPGSLADKCGLHTNDEIIRIGNNEVFNLYHKEAQQLIINSGDNLQLVLQRGSNNYSNSEPTAFPSSYDNQDNQNNYSQGGHGGYQPPQPYQVTQQMGGMSLNQHARPFQPAQPLYGSPGGSIQDMPSALNMPTEEPPKPVAPKVSAGSNLQYNTPIRLYSNDNVSETIETNKNAQQRTGPGQNDNDNKPVTNGKKTSWVASDTFKMIQEEEQKKAEQKNREQRHSREHKFLMDREDKGPAVHSRSFLRLQQALESPSGSPSPPRTSPHSSPKISPKVSPKNSPKAPRTNPVAVHAQYNTPKGLYSNASATEAFKTQTGMDVDVKDGNDAAANLKSPDGKKIYHPSETYRLVHESESPRKTERSEKVIRSDRPEPVQSRTLKMLQHHLENASGDKNSRVINSYSDEPSRASPSSFQNSYSDETFRAAPSYQNNSRDSPPTAPVMYQVEAQVAPRPKKFSNSIQVSTLSSGPPSGYSSGVTSPTWNPQQQPSFNPAGHQSYGGPPSQGRSTGPPSQVHSSGPPSHTSSGGGGRWQPPPRGTAKPRFFKPGEASMRQPEAQRIPVCSGCNQPVRGPFILALGKSWCPNHFNCANPDCGMKLIDVGFVEENGQLYCEKDYETYFAPRCAKCKTAVMGECIKAMNAEYHPHCFICTHCRQPIGGGEFHTEDGLPYCNKDWQEMFQSKCAGCEFPIEPGDRWVEALDGQFHSECFNCTTCQVNLEGQPFCAKNGKPYCKKHASSGRF